MPQDFEVHHIAFKGFFSINMIYQDGEHTIGLRPFVEHKLLLVRRHDTKVTDEWVRGRARGKRRTLSCPTLEVRRQQENEGKKGDCGNRDGHGDGAKGIIPFSLILRLDPQVWTCIQSSMSAARSSLYTCEGETRARMFISQLGRM